MGTWKEFVRASGVRFLAVLLAVTFAAEVGVMLLLQALFRAQSFDWVEASIDAFTLDLLVAPVLWYLAAGPLEAEAALQASEKRYRSVVQNVDEIVYVMEMGAGPMAGRMAFISDRIEASTGYRPQEFLDQPDLWTSLIHPDDRSSVASSTAWVLAERRPATRGYRLRHKATGTYRWISDRVVPHFGGEGSGVRLFGAVRDTTGRAPTEEKLRATEDRYREMFMNDVMGAYISTPAGALVACNPAFAAMCGFGSIEEAQKAGAAAIYLTPEDREAFLARLESERQIEYSPTQYRRRDGGRVHVIENAVGVFDERGELVEIRGHLIDTSQLTRFDD